MKKRIIVATLSISILLLAGTTALGINNQSTQSQNTAQANKAVNSSHTPRYIQEIEDEFTDIKNDWSREEVLEARAKGFVTGYEDSTFRPNASVSKLETLVLIINAMGLSEEAKAYDLSDEQEDLLASIPDWGQNYMALALDKGILIEEELPGFNPQQAAKRYEVCMYMNRVLADADTTEESDKVIFTDENQIPSANQEAVRRMWQNGVVSGYPDGKFQPMKAVKRNELITMLNKLDDNCLQAFAASTVSGTVYAITEIDSGYKITVENAKGAMVDVNTNAETKIIYKGHELKTIDIESALKVRILLNQDGEAVLVRLADTENEAIVDNEVDEIDDIDEIDAIDELDEDNDAGSLKQLEKNNKPNQNNKINKLDQIDTLE